MKVRLIQPEGRPWQRPQCEAEVNDQTKRWRDRARNGVYQCERVALYRVGTVAMCRLHAGHAVLEQALKEGK